MRGGRLVGYLVVEVVVVCVLVGLGVEPLAALVGGAVAASTALLLHTEGGGAEVLAAGIAAGWVVVFAALVRS